MSSSGSSERQEDQSLPDIAWVRVSPQAQDELTVARRREDENGVWDKLIVHCQALYYSPENEDLLEPHRKILFGVAARMIQNRRGAGGIQVWADCTITSTSRVEEGDTHRYIGFGRPIGVRDEEVIEFLAAVVQEANGILLPLVGSSGLIPEPVRPGFSGWEPQLGSGRGSRLGANI